MLFLYHIIIFLITIFSPIILFYRILKNKEDKKRYIEKFSITSKKRVKGKLIWFHGASVGELQSIIPIIEKLEKNGKGLNLNLEVIEGIKRHSKPQGKFLNKELVNDLFLEAQIVRISDMIAYTTSDINDAIRANIIELNSIPKYIIDYLGNKHSERVNTLVTNVIENSIDCSYINSNEPWIRMSPDSAPSTSGVGMESATLRTFWWRMSVMAWWLSGS